MSRYAAMMKMEVRKARVRVEMDYFLRGSVLRQTVESGCTGARTHFELESDEPPERIAALIRNAKQGCFAENMVQTAVPLTSTLVVNRKPFDLEAYPRPKA